MQRLRLMRHESLDQGGLICLAEHEFVQGIGVSQRRLGGSVRVGSRCHPLVGGEDCPVVVLLLVAGRQIMEIKREEELDERQVSVEVSRHQPVWGRLFVG